MRSGRGHFFGDRAGAEGREAGAEIVWSEGRGSRGRAPQEPENGRGSAVVKGRG